MDNCFFLFADSRFSRNRLLGIVTRWVSAFAYVGFESSLMSPPSEPCS